MVWYRIQHRLFFIDFVFDGKASAVYRQMEGFLYMLAVLSDSFHGG